MNVQELIDKLMLIEDKQNTYVIVEHFSYDGTDAEVSKIEEAIDYRRDYNKDVMDASIGEIKPTDKIIKGIKLY